MIKRTKTHVIDTLAVRQVISSLPEDWLVRGLEERDYGIDLTLEIFEGEDPTGRIALVQVKGTDKDFEDEIKLSFPTKTIEYSLLFPQPFLIFYASIKGKKTYYVWAQKYSATKLEIDCPNWKSQDSATIYFPKENELSKNKNKISEIMSLYSARNDGLEFLAAYECLAERWDSFKNGSVDLIESCNDYLSKIKQYKTFFSVYMNEFNNVDFLEMQNCIELLSICVKHKSGDGDSISECVCSIDKQINELYKLKRIFLDHSDMDKFDVENSTGCPY